MDLTRIARISVTATVLLGIGVLASNILASDGQVAVDETKPSVKVVDPVLALSVDQALEFEAEIKKAYDKLAPSVVRLYERNEESGFLESRVSGVIIDEAGLILTCSHHRIAPETEVTIELADGKRAAGKILGRFQIDNLQPMDFGFDLGLAKITEPGQWPAATVGFGAPSGEGHVSLAIGYPGTLRPGRPPLLRVGRFTPSFPGIPWLKTTTAIALGDSGGPLFDLAGRVVGIASGGDSVAPAGYQSLSVLKEFRKRLESGEIVLEVQQAVRTKSARPAQSAAFIPLPDLETQVLQTGRNVIRIMDGPHAIAAGLIVDANGLAITKASLVGSRQEWSCRLFYLGSGSNGKVIVKGRVIATSPEHDLALMKIDVRKWPVVPWSRKRPVVGTIVSSPLGRSAGPIQFSVVGAEVCDEPAASNDIPQIRLSVEPNPENAPTIKQSEWAAPEFDYYRELFQSGDVVTHLNETPTPTFSVYGHVIDRLHYAARAKTGDVDYNLPAPGSFHGDWVSIGIRRGTETRVIRIPKVHSTNQGALSWHSNPLSLRREAFPMVFAHDGRLSPEECGGPVVDLDGHVVGLNIARVDTARTLAMPADVLQKVISELQQQANGVVK